MQYIHLGVVQIRLQVLHRIEQEPSNRWIDPQFHPIAVQYQSLMQEIEDRITFDSGISMDEMAEIQANLTTEEDNAISQAIIPL